MSAEAPRTEVELQIGQMPKPKFLDILSPFENGAKPIGIMTPSLLTGEEKTFVWWENFRCDLNSRTDRSQLALFLTRLTMSRNAEFAVGWGINLKDSQEKSGRVKILSANPKRVGIYVEPSGRTMLSWRTDVGGVATERDIRVKLAQEGKPNDFDSTLAKISSALPKPTNSL